MTNIRFTTAKPKKSKETVFVEIIDENKAQLVEARDGSFRLRVGVGRKSSITWRKLQTLVRKALQTARDQKYTKVVLSLSDLRFSSIDDVSEEERVSFIVQNALLANFAFTKFKSKPDARDVKELVLVGKPSRKLREAVRRGRIVAEEANKCRELSNTPGGDMTPKLLAEAAKAAVKGLDVKVTVLGKKDLQKQKMGAILGVAQGSSEEPKFIIMEYKGGSKSARPTVLVGKGVTFDTGGLNLKPSDGIFEMHMDMSGGASVIHTVAAAARLKLSMNVVGLVPAVENMPSGSSYRPGDVLRSLSGKTIEVLNTDAEGRVILSDALTYAKKYNPAIVIDVATLTGAALVSLGQHAHAVMSRDEEFVKEVCKAGEHSGEYVWPLPLWEEYEQYVPGNFGDVANLPPNTNSRYAGSTMGGMFLREFTKEYSKDTKWVHIDMAPRMTAAPGDFLAKGATGEPTRLLIRILEKESGKQKLKIQNPKEVQ